MARVKSTDREESLMERMAREAKEFDEKHPILDTRYYVDEYNRHDGYYIGDDRTPAPSTFVRRFGPFAKNTMEKWLEEHEPDEGHHFVPRYENLRHYCYDKWGR